MNDDEITAAWLGRHPLPQPDPEGDKNARGHVMMVAGSREMPGAALLSATAALRAGAGKLTIGTAASASTAVAGPAQKPG